jgi:hypothetical protein
LLSSEGFANMRRRKPKLRNCYYAVGIIVGICAIVYYTVAIAHYYPMQPVFWTTTSTTLVSLQTTAVTTATTTEVTTSTSTAITTASTTVVTTATTTETTQTAAPTTSSTNVELLITIFPQHGWRLLPNGTRYATIPANESETFTVRINNTGQFPVQFWGMVVDIEYIGESLTFYQEQRLQPGESVELTFIFGTNLARPSDVTFANIVFKIIGNGWSKEEPPVLIYFAH